MVNDHASKEKEGGRLEFDAWPNLGNFWKRRKNFRCEVSLCASRPMSEIEYAKSVAELKDVKQNHRGKDADNCGGS